MSPAKQENIRLKLFEQEVSNDLSFIYYGAFSDRVNDALVPLAEVLIENSSIDLKIRKRAFYIFVECIQNVNRHRCKEKKEKDFPNEVFSVKQKKNRFNIAFGNLIYSSNVNLLKDKIDDLNNTSIEELNHSYKRILRDTVLSKLGGAGLGLIEVARKSGNKIKYRFESLDATRSYFMMETNINEPNTGLEFPEFDGLASVDTYKEVFRENSFAFMMKTDNDSLIELKERDMYPLLNKLDRRAFFKVKNPELYLEGIIDQIVLNCTDHSIMQKGMIVSLESSKKGKSLSFCWSGERDHVKECRGLLASGLRNMDKAASGKKTGFGKFLELVSLLQYKSSRKIQIETGEDTEGRSLLFVRVPLS